MAAVQGLLKKHDALETDFVVHKDRCVEICNAGNKLVAAKNHHSPVITQRCEQLQVSIVPLREIVGIFLVNSLAFFASAE